MTPAISVVMLCYNHEKYVREAIDSVLLQSYPNFELIVVDDGSTDKSRESIGSIEDPRLRVIQQPNGGPSAASIAAVTQARAPLIALMSADDVCHRDRLRLQTVDIEEHNADVTFCRPQLIDDNGAHLPDDRWPVFFKRSFTSQHDLYRKLFWKGNFICATSVMFRSSLLEKHGYVHSGLIQLQDFLWWARLAPHAKFHCSEKRYLSYRVRKDSGNLSSRRNKWRANFEKRIVYREFFDGAPQSFLAETFENAISEKSEEIVFEAQKACLLLRHINPAVKSVGAEKLIDLMRSRENSLTLRHALGLEIRDVYAQIEAAILDGNGHRGAGADAIGGLQRKPNMRLIPRLFRSMTRGHSS